MTLLLTVNKKYKCNFPFINVISRVVISKVLISIVAISTLYNQYHCKLFYYFPRKKIFLETDKQASWRHNSKHNNTHHNEAQHYIMLSVTISPLCKLSFS